MIRFLKQQKFDSNDLRLHVNLYMNKTAAMRIIKKPTKSMEANKKRCQARMRFVTN